MRNRETGSSSDRRSETEINQASQSSRLDLDRRAREAADRKSKREARQKHLTDIGNACKEKFQQDLNDESNPVRKRELQERHQLEQDAIHAMRLSLREHHPQEMTPESRRLLQGIDELNADNFGKKSDETLIYWTQQIAKKAPEA